jgi:hypothetical protein
VRRPGGESLQPGQHEDEHRAAGDEQRRGDQPPAPAEAPGKEQEDRQRDRQADHLAQKCRPLLEHPLGVALPLEPVATAPPELQRAERQADRPDAERRHRPDHHAGRHPAELPGARDPRAEVDEQRERPERRQRRSHPEPA